MKNLKKDSVKIIQIVPRSIVARTPMLGLGDDGVIYGWYRIEGDYFHDRDWAWLVYLP